MLQSATEIHDLVGSRIERFAIRAKLGSGGMGEVFLAEDTLLKRPVAIKAIRPGHSAEPDFRKRLLHEAERASQLNDEHVTRIYDVFEHAGRAFLVMEYVEGETLRARLGKPLATEELFRLAEQCLAGLAAAHVCGILHCDLKPENIMITPAGLVKILDFGFARRAAFQETRDSLDLSSAVGGTLAYMAPEVLMGQTPRACADIFSLGVILYEALTGSHPFRFGWAGTTAGRIIGEEPRPIRGPVLAGLDAVILRMLRKDPAQRYQTCADVLADLRAVREGRRVAAPKKTILLRPMFRTIPLVMAVFALLLSWPSPSPTAPAPPAPRLLAILPFQPADANDATSRALANGLTATVTAKLGELAEHYRLQIVPAAELRAQKAGDAREARAMLGATLALAGSLQPSGQTLRVTYSLMDTSSLRQLHAGVITEEASNIFELQNHVIGEVLNSLDIELATEDLRRMKLQGTTRPRAYDSYVRGFGYLHVYDRAENLDNAIAAFQASLQADPRFALAYAGLGQAYLQKKIDTPEELAQARDACSRAVELDSTVPDGEICLGMLFNRTGEYEQAARHLERAVQLDARRDESFRELAQAYEGLKRLDDAESSLKRAIAIRPQYWAGYKRLGKFYYNHGRSDEAIEQFHEVVKLAPGNFSNYSNLGAIYVIQGRYDEAIPVLEESIRIRRTPPALSNLGVAYLYQGKYQEAARTLEDAIELTPSDHRIFFNLAEAYAQIPGARKQSNTNYTHALRLAEQELGVNRRDAQTLSYAALYAARLGQGDKAELYREQALSLSSHDPQIRENSALVLAQLRQDNRALAELDQAISEGLRTPQITHNPAWRRFTADPRYAAIIARAQGK